MTAKLFKDVTASQTHVTTALGNGKKPKKDKLGAPSPFAGLTIDAAKAFDKAAVVKVDESLGLVFGFAIVCKQDGADWVQQKSADWPVVRSSG